MIRYLKSTELIKWKNNLLYGGGKIQWTSLYHNGPLFPSEYIPHNIPVIINNNKIQLPPLAEEYATMYSKYIDTEYINNKNFKKNFFKDFKQTLPKSLNVNSIDQIDFSLIRDYIIKQKTLLTKEEKQKIKEERDVYEEPYKFCIVDGIKQSVGSFRIEPPAIFIGRGNHPKIGLVKKRIYPEDVTINVSKDFKVPAPNLPGHKWGKIINDPYVIWLASWKDPLSNKMKYIFTSFDSFFKSKSDENKYNLARKLKRKVSSIREEYEKQLNDKDIKTRQLATALYFIDHLALRVGGSKDTKEEADTVGVTSLRVEHITLLDDNNIKLDFLGKDSIRYCKKINVLQQIHKNLAEFINNKSKKEDIFDYITPNTLNEYLNSFMEHLTSKVWRTYNASNIFQKELDKIKEDTINKMDQNERLNFLITMFNHANAEVAILCNHQKNINANIESSIEKINLQIKKIRDKIKTDNSKVLKDKLKNAKLKKETKIKLKNISLGTSKNNYIDPRIIFAFIKKYNIPPEKLFTKSLLKRFEWAEKSVSKDFRF